MWTILATPNCSWCRKAVDLILLKDADADIDYIDISQEDSLWLKSLMQKAYLRTVPQIFDPLGFHINGYEALEGYFSYDPEKQIGSTET